MKKKVALCKDGFKRVWQCAVWQCAVKKINPPFKMASENQKKDEGAGGDCPAAHCSPGLCRDCKYWGAEYERTKSGGFIWKNFERMKNIEAWALKYYTTEKCQRITHNWTDWPIPESQCAEAIGDECEGIGTGPEFGCIHFQEKNDGLPTPENTSQGKTPSTAH